MSWQKIARQLTETDALLNKYVEILYRSEDVARLIFDEDWQGAEAVSYAYVIRLVPVLTVIAGRRAT